MSGIISTVGSKSGIVGSDVYPAGHSVQMRNYRTGAVDTGTSIISIDDTIPQITEGDEYMTLAITPENAANELVIEVGVAAFSSSATNHLIIALFVGTTANALTCVYGYADSTGNTRRNAFLSYKMVAGVDTELTFRVRIGAHDSGTTTINGYGGIRKLGGRLYSSITITEYKPNE